MNKAQLMEQFKILIRKNLELATQAAKNTYDIATHEENKPENKYDTRGLEASYLAGAQAERVNDIKSTLVAFDSAKFFKMTGKISLGTLVKLEQKDKVSYVLIMPKGGGLQLQFENHLVQVITPESPMGQLLIGKEAGDLFNLNSREYEIIELT